MKSWAMLWVWQESHLPQRLTLKNEAGFQSFTFLAPVDTISKAQFLVLWKILFDAREKTFGNHGSYESLHHKVR